MKKEILTEEIYRMRKLMNFDSKDYYENTTSYDKLFEEKLRTKRLLKEEDEPNDFIAQTDWSDGGKFNWGNAKLKNIVKYVMEIDASLGGTFTKTVSYKLMMNWFLQNDSQQTRESLKNWMFGDIYYGIPNTSTDVKKSKKKGVEISNNFDRNLQDELTTKLESASKKESAAKQSVNKLNIEIKEFNKNNILIDKEELSELNLLIDLYLNFQENDDYDSIEKVIEELTGRYEIKRSTGMGVDIGDNDTLAVATPKQAISYKMSAMGKMVKQLGDIDGKTLQKAMNSLVNIEIGNDSSKSSGGGWKDKITEKKITSIIDKDTNVLSYPDNDTSTNERNEQSKQFFPDDGIKIGPEAETAMQEIIKELSDIVGGFNEEVDNLIETSGIKTLKLEVLSINLFLYSSTSKVRTTYGSNDKVYSEKNNIQLAKDRIKTMENGAKSIIGRSRLKNYKDVTQVLTSDDRPNIGPGWKDLIGKTWDGKDIPVTSEYYGEMFINAYNIYKKKFGKELTPQKFFGARDNSAVNSIKELGIEVSQRDLSEEYNRVYGKYRNSMFGINVSLRMPEVVTTSEKEEEFFIISTPNLSINLVAKENVDWSGIISKIKKKMKKLGRKIKSIDLSTKPRGRVIKLKNICSTCCPKW